MVKNEWNPSAEEVVESLRNWEDKFYSESETQLLMRVAADLIEGTFDGKRVVALGSLDEAEGMAGVFVKVPQYRFPIYIPKRNADGVAILPKEWFEND